MKSNRRLLPIHFKYLRKRCCGLTRYKNSYFSIIFERIFCEIKTSYKSLIIINDSFCMKRFFHNTNFYTIARFKCRAIIIIISYNYSDIYVFWTQTLKYGYQVIIRKFWSIYTDIVFLFFDKRNKYFAGIFCWSYQDAIILWVVFFVFKITCKNMV